MGILGLLLALATLIYLALRGVNIIIAALTSSIIVLVTNDLNIAEGLSNRSLSESWVPFLSSVDFFCCFWRERYLAD